jgi:hypothetical protein
VTSSSAVRMLTRSELQRKIHEDSAQPYMRASIVGDRAQGTLLKLVVRNEGPTVATNIKAIFDPRPVPSGLSTDGVPFEDILDRLANGLSSLAPGHRIQWVFDTGPNFFEGDGHPTTQVTVTCDGPYGPCTPNTYIVDLEDIRHSLDVPDGSLHRVAERLKDLTKVRSKAPPGTNTPRPGWPTSRPSSPPISAVRRK